MPHTRTSRLAALLVAGVMLVLPAESLPVAAAPTPWQQRYPTSNPTWREQHAMVYDAARGRTILFGGAGSLPALDDTWEYDGRSWRQLAPTVRPPGRFSHAMAFDGLRGRTVLFGGRMAGPEYTPLGDTWEWDGVSWHRQELLEGPSPRGAAAMAFDDARGDTVLFGGRDAAGDSAETWTWNGQTWWRRQPAASPPARAYAAIAYDAARQRIVLFGGYTAGNPLDDTWEWDGETWREISPATRPSGRWSAAMAYDAHRGRTLLFGGRTGGAIGAELLDTWEWDGIRWYQVATPSSPAGRAGSALVYDNAHERAVLFGGCCTPKPALLDDTWEFVGTDPIAHHHAIHLPFAVSHAVTPSPLPPATRPETSVFLPMVQRHLESASGRPSPEDPSVAPAVWSHYISTNGIQDLALDEARSELWVASWGGLVKWSLSTETYTTYSRMDGLAHNEVWGVDIDAAGNKWFATGGGVSRLSADGTTWWSLPGDGVGSVIVDPQDNKWFGGRSGMHVLSADNTTWTTYTTENGLASNEAWRVAFDADGNVWVATTAGASMRSARDGTWRTYTQADGMVADGVNDIAIDAEGNKWFVHDDGVSVLSSDNATWTTHAAGDGLPTLLSLAIDDRGVKWFGASRGIVRLSPDGSTWTAMPSTDHDASSRAFTNVYAVVIDRAGARWFAGEGQVARLAADEKSWTVLATDGMLADDTNRAAAVAPNGDVWFGSNWGVSRLPADGRSAQTYSTGDGLGCDVVNAIAFDVDGSVWFGGWISASYRALHPEAVTVSHLGADGAWTSYDDVGDEVLDIAIDRQGTKWFATGTGIVRMSAEGAWLRLAKDDFPALRWGVDAIAVGHDGRVWFANWRGLHRLSADLTELDSFTSQNGLAGPQVFDIAVAENGDVWAAGVVGASRVAARDDAVTSYFASTGGRLRVRLDGQDQALSYRGNAATLGIRASISGELAWFGSACAGTRGRPDVRGRIAIVDATGCGDSRVIEPTLAEAGARAAIVVSRNDEFLRSGRPPNSGVPTYYVEPRLGTALLEATQRGDAVTIAIPPPPQDLPAGGACPMAEVHDVAVDARGDVWAGLTARGSDACQGGVARLDRDSGRWSRYSDQDGLMANEIVDIATDAGNGDVWVAQFYGVSRLMEREPGDSCASAMLLNTDTTSLSEVRDAADIDVFALNLARPFSRLEVSVPDAGNQLDVYLVRSCGAIGGGRRIGSGRRIGDEQRLVLDVTSRTGTYYLVVRPRPGSHAYPISYRMRTGLSKIDLASKRTLILTHEPAIRNLFLLQPDAPELVAWQERLQTLAASDKVAGYIVWDLKRDTNAQVAEAYREWELTTDPSLYYQRANRLALALRDWIWERHATDFPRLQYIVLAGDDRVIPHLRVRIDPPPGAEDDGWMTEDAYFDEGTVGAGTTIGSALALDLALSDDVYAAPTAVSWSVLALQLHLPRLAVGRLVERPADMSATIDAFLDSEGRIDVTDSLVTGYDFMQDGAEVGDTYLAAAGLDEGHRQRLMGNDWTVDALRDLLTEGRFDLGFFAAHARHFIIETPNNGFLRASELASALPDAAGKVAYGLACHAGLNTPGDHPEAIDFPEVWSRAGGTFIGSTGWAYGFEEHLQYQEKLMAELTRQLAEPGGAAVGEALTAAKAAYYGDLDTLNHLHAKTLAGTVLYGLPMRRVTVMAESGSPGDGGIADGGDLPAGTRWEPQSLRRMGDAVLVEQTTMTIPRASLRLVETDAGSYYTFSDQPPRVEGGEPVQPRLRKVLSELDADGAALAPRGVVWLGAQYDVVPGFTPMIRRASALGESDAGGGAMARGTGNPMAVRQAVGWGRGALLSLRTLGELGSLLVGRRDAHLFLTVGQYDGATSTERLYRQVTSEVYYSDRLDEIPPAVQAVETERRGPEVAVTVTATDDVDGEGVARVVVTFTDGAGTWRSVELAERGPGTWVGSVPTDVEAIVQAVDGAGNVGVDAGDTLPLRW